MTLNLRITPNDDQRLGALTGVVPKSIVARAALRLGLERLEADPALILKAGATERKSDEGEAPTPKRGRRQ